MNSISLEKIDIVLDPLGFLRIIFKNSDEDVNLQEARNQVEACREVAKDRRMPVLLDSRKGLPPMSQGAFKYFAKNEFTHLRTAEAILINDLSKRIMARFYYLFHKPKNPLRIFSNEKEAVLWLKNYINI